MFALYGGFFSVLLGSYGLAGSSHGIGFGESRDWVELPSSGAPPARYYVPRLHRYVAVDLAEIIWSQFPDLIVCDCRECGENSPAALDYHALMKHSVLVRDREIREWGGLSADETIARLTADAQEFRESLSSLVAPERIVRRASELYGHLFMWARVISELPQR
ncbi:hypothetical protein CSX12_01320 [Microbacterium sp. Y-01]|nr:hypothetical protein CSX12_01320 [Microbacterium sp. Y-01]